MKPLNTLIAGLILLLAACALKGRPFDAMDFEPEGRSSPHGGYVIPAGAVHAELLLTPERQTLWLMTPKHDPVATDPATCRGLVLDTGNEQFWLARGEDGAFTATELNEAHEKGLRGRLLFRDCPVEGAEDAGVRIDPARGQFARHGGEVFSNADYMIEAVRQGDTVRFYLSTPEQTSIDAAKVTLVLLYDMSGRSLPIARAQDGSCLYARVPARPGRGRLMFHIFNEELDLEVRW